MTDRNASPPSAAESLPTTPEPMPVPLSSYTEQYRLPADLETAAAALSPATVQRAREMIERMSSDISAQFMAYGTVAHTFAAAPVPMPAPRTADAPTESDGPVTCSCCSDEKEVSDTRKINGEVVCDDCRMDNYFVCICCNDTERNDACAGQDQRGNDVCTSCAEREYIYSELQECYVLSRRAVRSDQGNYADRSWANDNWFCSDDGDWYESEDDLPESEESEPENGMFEYHAKDVVQVCGWDKRNARNALVFGVELEMEPDGYDQSDVSSALNGPQTERYILAHDGSLNDGVELITVPLTLAQHRKDFGWEKILEPVLTIAKAGAGTDRCGMHVHINRAALTPLQIGKIMVFLNSSLLEEHMVRIAQRDSNSYCERKPKMLTSGRYTNDCRYERANLTDRTLEIRMFRSNLRHERVLKNIEFCEAMVHYTRECSMREIESWNAFSDWLLKRKHEYPELVRFLDEKRAHGFRGAARLTRINKKTGKLVKAPAESEEV